MPESFFSMSSDSKDLAGKFKRMSFKGNKVWAATRADGKLAVDAGKVRIKYNLEQDYEYQVKPENLKPVEEAVSGKKREKSSSEKNSSVGKKAKARKNSQAIKTVTFDPDEITIFTDGASSCNPGPSGIGVLLLYKNHKKEISKSIGTATNNIAELTAILTALKELKRYDIPVRIFTDSSYSIGVLSRNWKARANTALINEIKELMNKFKDIKVIKVKAHSGIKENEIADFLATSAIEKDG